MDLTNEEFLIVWEKLEQYLDEYSHLGNEKPSTLSLDISKDRIEEARKIQANIREKYKKVESIFKRIEDHLVDEKVLVRHERNGCYKPGD